MWKIYDHGNLSRLFAERNECNKEADHSNKSFEDYDFYDLRDPKKLYAYIKERLLPDQMNYIFLDEIQQCEDFPKVVDSLYIKNNVDLYVTGSNKICRN